MNSWKIGNKLIALIVGSSIIGLVLALVLFGLRLNIIKEHVYDDTAEQLKRTIVSKVDAKAEICITNAISIANDNTIVEALKIMIELQLLMRLKDYQLFLKKIQILKT